MVLDQTGTIREHTLRGNTPSLSYLFDANLAINFVPPIHTFVSLEESGSILTNLVDNLGNDSNLLGTSAGRMVVVLVV